MVKLLESIQSLNKANGDRRLKSGAAHLRRYARTQKEVQQ